MGDRLTCDIGIVSFDCFPELEACLESIFLKEKTGLRYVFVVENSNKDIPHGLKDRFPGVIWEKSKKNLGFARACNRIISRSQADYLLLINPDTYIMDGIVKDGCKWLDENRDVAVVGPRILDADGNIQASARRFPSLSTAFFGRSSLLSKYFPSNSMTRKNLLTWECQKDPIEVDWVSGACIMVRLKAIRQVGPLDEGFFMYWEDCDWCTRFRKAGWKVIYHPGLGPIRHKAGSSSDKAPMLCHFHFHKSAVRLYSKYDTSLLRTGTFIAITGALCRFLLLFPGVLVRQCR